MIEEEHSKWLHIQRAITLKSNYACLYFSQTDKYKASGISDKNF